MSLDVNSVNTAGAAADTPTTIDGLPVVPASTFGFGPYTAPQAPAPATTVDDAVAFIESVTPTEGDLVLCELAGGKMRNILVTDDARQLAETAIRESAAGRTIYFALGGYAPGAVTEWKGRKQANVVALRSMWLDIDGGWKDGKPRSRYATPQQAAEAVAPFVQAAGLPEPMFVHSGAGAHVYWSFTADVRPEWWRAQAVKLTALTRHLELDADHSRTEDEASVLRPVGTRNHRVGREVRLKVARTPVAPEAWEAALDAAIARFGVVVKEARNRSTPQADALGAVPEYLHGLAGADLIDLGLDGPPRYADRVIARCLQATWCEEHPTEVSEPLWTAMLSNLRLCEGGREAAHEFSALDPARYAPEDTDRKLDHLDASYPNRPFGCATIETLRPGGCDGCRYRAGGGTKGKELKAPIQLGEDTRRAAAERADRDMALIERAEQEGGDGAAGWGQLAGNKNPGATGGRPTRWRIVEHDDGTSTLVDQNGAPLHQQYLGYSALHRLRSIPATAADWVRWVSLHYTEILDGTSVKFYRRYQPDGDESPLGIEGFRRAISGTVVVDTGERDESGAAKTEKRKLSEMYDALRSLELVAQRAQFVPNRKPGIIDIWGAVSGDGHQGTVSVLNTFPGLRIPLKTGQPALGPEHWPNIYTFLHDSLADGDEAIYEFLCKLLAHRRRYPHILPAIILILQGRGGTGKDSFKWLAKGLIGPTLVSDVAMGTLRNTHATAPFRNLMVYSSEASLSSITVMDAMKNWTGGGETEVNEKHERMAQRQVFAVIVIGTNHIDSIAQPDRRLVLVDTSDRFRRNEAFWSAYYSEVGVVSRDKTNDPKSNTLADTIPPELQAFATYLDNLEVPEQLEPVVTAAQRRATEGTLGPVADFLVEALQGIDRDIAHHSHTLATGTAPLPFLNYLEAGSRKDSIIRSAVAFKLYRAWVDGLSADRKRGYDQMGMERFITKPTPQTVISELRRFLGTSHYKELTVLAADVPFHIARLAGDTTDRRPQGVILRGTLAEIRAEVDANMGTNIGWMPLTAGIGYGPFSSNSAEVQAAAQNPQGPPPMPPDGARLH